MSDQNFESLLKRMADIAPAVNAFTSEAVQKEAFTALLGALGGDRSYIGSATVGDAAPEVGRSNAGNGAAPRARLKRQRAPRSRSDVRVIKDLNLRPDGKPSFSDFATQKAPKTNEEKYAVAVYYLEQILGLSAVTDAHVSTVFRLTDGWREPKDVAAGLRKTAERKATIDTSDLDAIKTTPHGRNLVQHDLPREAAAE